MSGTEPDRLQGGREPGGQTELAAEPAVARFVAEWRRGRRPAIQAHLPTANHPQRPAILLALVKADMEQRSKAGEPIRVEDYTQRFPELLSAGAGLEELVIQEFWLRCRAGQKPPVAEYRRRFPQQFATLQARLADSIGSHDAEAARQDDGLSATLPPTPVAQLVPGAVIGDYEIIQALGRGGLACVYVARQLSLGRLVALKVSEQADTEGHTLARLEHENIVPVYAQSVVAGRRLLAMRYVPGITLEKLLHELASHDRRECNGDRLLVIIDRCAPAASPGSAEPGGERLLAGCDFAAAACHIMLGLARAAEHAHQQGIVHQDIKPANVMLDRSGRAMLMDFNMARDHAASSAAGPSVLGGTPAYMSPEQLAAVAPQLPAPPQRPDHRCDIYSLGLIFYEFIAGRLPFATVGSGTGGFDAAGQMLAERLGGAPPLPRVPGVSLTAGLRGIVAKCLHPDPARRYQSAGQLAEDLRRHLARRPLRYVREPAPERLGKWLRRQPAWLSVPTAAAVLLLALLLVGGMVQWRRLQRAELLLDRAAYQIAGDNPEAAAGQVAEAAELLAQRSRLLVAVGLADRLQGDRRRFRQLFGQLVEQTYRRSAQAAARRRLRAVQAHRRRPSPSLPHYRPPPTDPLALYGVVDNQRWQQNPLFQGLDANRRAEVLRDVTELLLLRALASLEGAGGPSERPAARRQAAALLQRVPSQYRHCRAIASLAAELDLAWPLPPPAEASGQPDEFDLYLQGITAARRSRWPEAYRHFAAAEARARASSATPRFWTLFMTAYAAARVGQTERAVQRYGECIRQRPQMAWPYHNLGLLHGKAGRLEQAVQCFRQALGRDPNLVPAYRELAVALSKLGRLTEAVDSCTKGLAVATLASEAASLLVTRGSLLAQLGRLDEARADLTRAIQLDPPCPAAQRRLQALQ